MSALSSPTPELPIPFVAELRPHRSLGSLGFRILLGAMVAALAIYGGIFLALGAWPVFGFMGAEFVLLYLLFRLNYRAARRRETIRIDREATEVLQCAPSGRETRHDFQTFWLRVEVDRPSQHDCRLVLSSHGRRVSIGSFLTAPERTELAGVLRDALSQVTARA